MARPRLYSVPRPQVLSDPALRDVHDRELTQAEAQSVLTYQDELDATDMDVQQAEGEEGLEVAPAGAIVAACAL